MKKLSQTGDLNEDTMLGIMMEQKKPEKMDITIPAEVLQKYFPRSYTPQKMQKTIINYWKAGRRNVSSNCSGKANTHHR